MAVIVATIVLILVCATIEELCATVVSIQVRPRIMIERGDVSVTVRVPSHPDNRRLVLAWDSTLGGQAGTSERDIDGDDGPVLFTFPLRDVTPANYTFVASVLDVAGKLRGRDEAFIVTPEVK